MVTEEQFQQLLDTPSFVPPEAIKPPIEDAPVLMESFITLGQRPLHAIDLGDGRELEVTAWEPRLLPIAWRIDVKIQGIIRRKSVKEFDPNDKPYLRAFNELCLMPVEVIRLDKSRKFYIQRWYPEGTRDLELGSIKVTTSGLIRITYET